MVFLLQQPNGLRQPVSEDFGSGGEEVRTIFNGGKAETTFCFHTLATLIILSMTLKEPVAAGICGSSQGQVMLLDARIHGYLVMICSRQGFEDMRLRIVHASTVTLYLPINVWG